MNMNKQKKWVNSPIQLTIEDMLSIDFSQQNEPPKDLTEGKPQKRAALIINTKKH